MHTTGPEYTAQYRRIGGFMDGIDAALYSPLHKKSGCGVVIMHSDSSYLSFSAGPELAARGYTALCANVSDPAMPLDEKLKSVQQAVAFLRVQDGISRIALLGHSGGATLMSCYQAVAENGPGIFRDEKRIVPMAFEGDLPTADALLLIDSNFGNGVMTLVSLDPGVADEQSGLRTDPAFDAYAPANGFSKGGDTRYSDAFLEKFFAAQAARQNRLIDHALSRYQALRRHEGRFADDEPLIVPGGSQIAPNNRRFPRTCTCWRTPGTHATFFMAGTAA